MQERDLERFVEAQDSGQAYERALVELRDGRKTSHWMWFVFPQIAGLGRSEMSQRYAIDSLEEARGYLDHPVLGTRLLECCDALLSHDGMSAEQILGGIDAIKLRSSMTLFLHASPETQTFQQVLDRYFEGAPDAATVGLL
jgi:uncharacterized protein (DUF1810 family)